MKIFSVFVFIDDGRCLFNQSFTALAPPTSLITGLLTAVQSFVQEVTGTNPEILSTGGFVFHMQKYGPITIALTTSDNDRPEEILSQLGIRFMKKYGSVEKWRGKLSDYADFEEDVEEILGPATIRKRIEPKTPLSALVLLNLEETLQDTAQAMIQMGRGNLNDVKDLTKKTEFILRADLEKLVEMGHLGRVKQENDFVYFI